MSALTVRTDIPFCQSVPHQSGIGWFPAGVGVGHWFVLRGCNTVVLRTGFVGAVSVGHFGGGGAWWLVAGGVLPVYYGGEVKAYQLLLFILGFDSVQGFGLGVIDVVSGKDILFNGFDEIAVPVKEHQFHVLECVVI